MVRPLSRPWPVAAAVSLALACGRGPAPSAAPGRPSILLVTLDTTRADAIGPEATPALEALAARGARFRQAYATAPETLPSHASMLTGLYPAGHGVHENARVVAGEHPLAAEALRRAGYRTAAFVSSFVLARRFGLARGFEVYDDGLPDGRSERTAAETTDRALAWLQTAETAPRFLWVHYFDAHAPYEPPEPYRARFSARPYLGEVAAVDEQLARLVAAFEGRATGPVAIVVAADHGEGLGDHGESQHGTLAYQATMHVPLVVVGPGVATGAVDAPVSTRRVFHTLLDWAGQGAAHSLRGPDGGEVVLGEAMKPFLSYGWQPQVFAIAGRHKTLRAGRDETYDVVGDPGETRDLGEAAVARPVRDALRDYPLPSLAPRREAALDDDARRRLAALGYVGAGAAPAIRPDAPRPADMARLFDVIDRASGLFVREEYAAVVPLLERILREDPGNLDAALRLATAHSSLGHGAAAERAFEQARALAPDSADVRAYLGLHYARGKQWPRAVPLLERAAEEFPDRVPVLEALAAVREREGRLPDALALRQRVDALRPFGPDALLQLGRLAMGAQQTVAAIQAFERARAARPASFPADLELGVLYLAERRLAEARDALDRVPAQHPAYPMALFKRAQVGVLLREPDARARIEAARKRADATTRPLIERERLFAAP
ncbi:MAG: sulfatase-like hydrolase/transferase [Vicinamibacteria bacterium]